MVIIFSDLFILNHSAFLITLDLNQIRFDFNVSFVIRISNARFLILLASFYDFKFNEI
jgi:hypothetical protein